MSESSDIARSLTPLITQITENTKELGELSKQIALVVQRLDHSNKNTEKILNDYNDRISDHGIRIRSVEDYIKAEETKDQFSEKMAEAQATQKRMTYAMIGLAISIISIAAPLIWWLIKNASRFG